VSALVAIGEGNLIAAGAEVVLGKLKIFKKVGDACCAGADLVKLRFTKKLSKTDAQKLADELQSLPSSKRPNTAAVIDHGNGTTTPGVNAEGITNNQVEEVLENAPKKYGGTCAEINALSKALNEGKTLAGSTITVVDIRGPNSKKRKHGKHKKPCPTCKYTLEFFGVEVKKK